MGWSISVVVDDADRSILVETSAAADGSIDARLPTVDLPDGEPSAELAVDLIEGLLGRAVLPIWMHYEEADDDLASGVGAVMVAGDVGRDAATGRAFRPAEPVLGGLQPEFVRGHVRAWLDRLAGNRDPRTQAWLDPGWHERVRTWIAERMTAAGLPPAGPTRLTYQSPIGMVLRTPSPDGNVFLKCPAPIFKAEASITRALAERTPGWVPQVIDIEPSEGWLLMSDLGPRQLGNEPEAAWGEGVRRLGEIQRAWVGHGGELLAAGAQHRPLAGLREAVPGLLETGDLGSRLGTAWRERWTGAQGRLVDACRELEGLGLPESLIHGDGHPWNVALTERGVVVFDWSDAALGPSFVDLAVFLFRVKDPAVRRDLRDAYLDAWSGIATRRRLERAAELAMPIGALYQAMTYLTLVPGLPPADQVVWAGSDAHWLRNAIEALDRGLDAIDQRLGA